MLTWREFAEQAPDFAGPTARLLYQHGVGLAYLATVDAAGAPRVHPVCPLLGGTGLHLFVIPSPKQRDLLRDGRFALHSFPTDDDEDAAYLTGRAVPVPDPGIRHRLAEQFVTERGQHDVPPPEPDHLLVELLVDRCLLTVSGGHGDVAPAKRLWHATTAKP